MRRLITKRASWATSGALAVAALAAVLATGPLGASASSPSPAASSWTLALSPAPEDFALAQLSFPHARAQRPSPRSLRIAVSGPFGEDYMASAVVAPAAASGEGRALVLVVNRPSPLFDPASVRLRVSERRSLGAAQIRRVANAFARPATSVRPALCDLEGGRPLSVRQLRVTAARGDALGSLDAAEALAQAYDASCALPYSSAFREAVQPAGAALPPAPGEPTPPAPASPPPPVGKLPGEGCTPAPGYACPG